VLEGSFINQQQSISCMRINYAGEVAAQGLYLGAGLLETNPNIKVFYQHAMEEEFKHLAWCGRCIYDLGGSVSLWNPLWFCGAVGLGMASRAVGSGYALGFVAETERQVLSHLATHLEILPQRDLKSRAVVKQMIEDEKAHGDEALSLGAYRLPEPVCRLMHVMGKVLTKLSAGR
jgi:ubiquinone biosynthesis monooxygenase Coq7